MTDAVGLTTNAVNDYRLLQPRPITDPNENVAEVFYTPLGFVKAVFARGRDGEGDETLPSVVIEYGLDVFTKSPRDKSQSIFVHTIRRVHH